MAPTVGADPRIGTEFAGYRIEDLLGRGGMSVVYLAEDLALARKVALKLMAPELAKDRSFRERFRRESRLAASLDHPNVTPIYEAGEAEGLLYIAMRYVDGTDLKSLLTREGHLAPERTLALLSQVAAALDAAHTRGLVHRDVKPSNILIADPEGDEHVYLADFGLTKTATEGEESESAQLSGTADYVSPEQIARGTSEPSSDLYSLGCVLYECLTGRVPFPRDKELAVLWAHVDEPPPRPTEAHPWLPRAVDDVIDRALSKEPAARYESASDLIGATRLAFPQRRTGRRRLLLAGAVFILLLTAAVSALMVARGGQDSVTRPTLDLVSGALQRVDTQTNQLVATVHLDGDPVDVAGGDGAVWVVDAARNGLVRIETRSLSIATQGGTGDLAAVGTSPAFPAHVGVAADGSSGVIPTALDAESMSEVGPSVPLRNLPGRPSDPLPASVSGVAAVAATERAGWFADTAGRTVTRIGRITPVPRVSIRTEGMPIALAMASRREVWIAERLEVSGASKGRLLRVHEDGNVRLSVPLAFSPSAIAVGVGEVWVTDPEGWRVWRLDPVRGRWRVVSVGGRPADVAVGAGSVWVVTAGRGKLVRIDPRTLDVVATIEVGSNPTALAVGEDGAWVAVEGDTPKALTSFPRRYRGTPYEVETVEPAAPSARCDVGLPLRDCFVVLGGRLTADDGTSAVARLAWRERRRQGGTVVCQGETYRGPVTSIVRGVAGTGRLDVAGWGVVALNLDRNVFAFSRIENDPASSGALCGWQSGTWAGTTGAIRGAGGTFKAWGPRNKTLLLTRSG